MIDDDDERVIVNHVIADLDATAKFGEMLARVARALIIALPRGQRALQPPSME